jgi:hypothetical protein
MFNAINAVDMVYFGVHTAILYDLSKRNHPLLMDDPAATVALSDSVWVVEPA